MVQDSEYVRIDPAGDVVERIAAPSPFALACVLGGPDRRCLFLDSADTSMERLRKGDSVGRIDVVEVPIPGTGLP
jgi:sugar lactone lactonase YvrE